MSTPLAFVRSIAAHRFLAVFGLLLLPVAAHAQADDSRRAIVSRSEALFVLWEEGSVMLRKAERLAGTARQE